MSPGAACWQPAYIGLGSNLESPATQLRQAFAALAELPHTRLVRHSSLWRSAPMGPPDQPDYVNAAAGLLTQLDALALLEQLQSIEQRHGRRRDGERWGPRILDLDLLVYADQRHTGPTLTLPHPGVAARAFVLAPLMQIAPALRVPDVGVVSHLLQAIDCSDLIALDD